MLRSFLQPLVSAWLRPSLAWQRSCACFASVPASALAPLAARHLHQAATQSRQEMGNEKWGSYLVAARAAERNVGMWEADSCGVVWPFLHNIA